MSPFRPYPFALALLLGLAAAVVGACPVFAQQDKPIGAEDIRSLVREFMANRGLPTPQDRDIWPVDERLSLAPCAHTPEITARSARSNSYIVHCKGPSAWDYTIRIENNGLANNGAVGITRAAPAPALPPAQALPQPAQQTMAAPQSKQPIETQDPIEKLEPTEKIEKASVNPTYPVVVPRVDLTAGTILTADMLDVRSMPQSPGTTAFRTIKEAVGLRLTANVGPSSILNTRNVAKAPQVLKGENITIIVNGTGFEIIAPGKAETDGYEGDLITVKNSKTGVKLTGKLGPGATVLVK